MWHVTHDTWHIGGPSQGVWRGGPMRGLGSGHVTCGPMRGLEINYAGRRHAHTHTHVQTDIATLWLNRPSGPIQWKVVTHILKSLIFNCLIKKFVSSVITRANLVMSCFDKFSYQIVFRRHCQRLLQIQDMEPTFLLKYQRVQLSVISYY